MLDTRQAETEGRGAPLSVSAAMSLAKGALEGITVRLLGEVSEVSDKAGYKAVYFTVKDQAASLPCMMWNNRYRSAGFQLRVGMLVELSGRFTLYAAKGRMNFDVFTLSLAGEGNLRMQVANLARKLQGEGLMDPARKRVVPAMPEVIGVVTSPRGAAVHDVMRTLRRRFPLSRVLLAGVPVEGMQAPLALAQGIRCVCDAGAQVVLLVRGGGSFEDLMPFNDEGLARAIARCPVPLVTGIGHEPDTTIADMVADLRASTPTAAAEAVAPDAVVLTRHLDMLGASLHTRASVAVGGYLERLGRISSHGLFSDSFVLFAQEAQALDDLEMRLPVAIPRSLERDGMALSHLSERLAATAPFLTRPYRATMQALSDRFVYQGDSAIEPFHAKVAMAATQLNALSPLAVLGRGYSIARGARGGVIRTVTGIAKGEDITLTLVDGELDCRVVDKKNILTSIESMEEDE